MTMDYIMSRKFSIPVNKENVIKYGILDAKYADRIPDEIVLTIPKDKDRITKPELFMLDLLSNYQWDRPINLLSMGGDINIGMKEYLMYEGFSYKFVPIKNKMSSSDIGFADPEDMYHKMKEVFSWDALKRTDYFVDYQNMYTFCGVLPQRLLFLNVAKEMRKAGRDDRAVEMLDMCQECVPEANFPLDISYLGFSNESVVIGIIEEYLELGQTEKAAAMAGRMADELFVSTDFFASFYDFASSDFEKCWHYLTYLKELMSFYGQTDLSEDIGGRMDALLKVYTGEV